MAQIFYAIFNYQSAQYMNLPTDHYDTRDPEAQEQFISKFNNEQRSFVLLAYNGPKISGHIIINNMGYQPAAHRALVVMGVQSDWRNMRVGSSLLRLSIEKARQANVLGLELRVRTINTAAIRLYEKFGFECASKIKAAAWINNQYLSECLYVINDAELLNLL